VESLRPVLGVDVGATKLAFAIVDPTNGSVLSSSTIATAADRGGTALLADCVREAERLSADREIAAVGIGVCELVNLDGQITSHVSIDWRNLDVAAAFAHIGPTEIESDVRAAALAEAVHGAGRGLTSFLYVNAGSGLSSCLVLDGLPYSGARGNAILIGAGPPESEQLAGGTGIARSLGVPSAAAAANSARAGDDQARKTIEQGGRAAGAAIAFAVNLLDPEAVVVGGGLALNSHAYWQELEDAARSQIWATDTRRLPILRSSFGSRAGVVGAALIACTPFAEAAR
jgi:glucokinase